MSSSAASERPRHKEAWEIYNKTIEEQELGFLSEFLDVADLDRMFGAGKWASMPRFGVQQAAPLA